MIIPPPKRPKSAEDSILPLINIVFLLLIFFMLAGVLASNPPFALRPPVTRQIGHQTQLANRVLSVGAQGQIAFEGRRLRKDQLAGALADWPEGRTLQVRADGHLKSGTLGALLVALRAAGVSEINLLTRHEDP